MVTNDTVELAPLVKETLDGNFDAWGGKYQRGWTSDINEMFLDSPDVEVICRGFNNRSPECAAIWRQGNLLHFGYDVEPEQLNDFGEDLLVNAIVYISQFQEDRPIPRVVDSFASEHWTRPRYLGERVLVGNRKDLSTLTFYFSPESLTNRADMAAMRDWFKSARPFIHADAAGLMTVDKEAQAFGVSFSTPEFFDAAITALRQGGEARERAARLLARYAVEGPAGGASTDQWQAWWLENKDYLFFSDIGGYRWYIDPLAKKRKIPSAKLRGPDRATRLESHP